jgi:hypothetical protein
MGNTDGTTRGNTGGQGGPGNPGNADNSVSRTDWTIDPEGAARAAGPPETAGHGVAHGVPPAQPGTIADTAAGGDQGEGASSRPDEVRGSAMPPLAPATEQTAEQATNQN